MVQVHLYRPFSVQHFVDAIPASCKKVAVLDRTKESGSVGEPLYLDVQSALQQAGRRDIQVVGGRYGLASKDTTPGQIAAVYTNLRQPQPKNNFTIGILDDVTHTSLPTEELEINYPGQTACKIWGVGGDGTVGANKNAITIIGLTADKYAQAYFSYDSMIYGRQSCDTRKLEKNADIDLGNAKFGGQEALVVLDHVFIPNEYLFLNGEYEFAGMMVERFAGYHRQSYGGCKVGVGDVVIGAAALAAEYNGVEKASAVKDKLIEMTHLNETLYSCGIACSCEGCPTKAGNYQIDLLLANVCKQNVTRFPYEIVRLAEDIAGGLMVTMDGKAIRAFKKCKAINRYGVGVDNVDIKVATECGIQVTNVPDYCMGRHLLEMTGSRPRCRKSARTTPPERS